MPALPSLALVIPVLNEAALLPGLLDHLLRLPGWRECIVTDGGSSDSTVAIAHRHAIRCSVLQVHGGRHLQLNAALAHTRCDGLLLIAADVRVHRHTCAQVRAALLHASHGCLRQRSALAPAWIRAQDAGSRLRARVLGGAYLDQAPFYRTADLHHIDGFRAVGPYDSADAGYRLGRQRFIALATPMTCSCRAYRTSFWPATVRNQQHRCRYVMRSVLDSLR